MPARTTTLEIRICSDLPTLNLIGDAVGYSFAETHVPTPAPAGVAALAAMGALRRRR